MCFIIVVRNSKGYRTLLSIDRRLLQLRVSATRQASVRVVANRYHDIAISRAYMSLLAPDSAVDVSKNNTGVRKVGRIGFLCELDLQPYGLLIYHLGNCS